MFALINVIRFHNMPPLEASMRQCFASVIPEEMRGIHRLFSFVDTLILIFFSGNVETDETEDPRTVLDMIQDSALDFPQKQAYCWIDGRNHTHIIFTNTDIYYTFYII